MHRDEFGDSILQFRHAGVRAALNLSLREQGKPALHLIEPGTIGGREVQVVAPCVRCTMLTQVMGSKVLDAGTLRGRFHNVPNRLGRDSITPDLSPAYLLAGRSGHH